MRSFKPVAKAEDSPSQGGWSLLAAPGMANVIVFLGGLCSAWGIIALMQNAGNAGSGLARCKDRPMWSPERESIYPFRH